MELSHGGHLSHGHQTSTRKVSETAYKFNAVPYQVDLETGIIDYDGLRSLAQQHKPKIITMGGSSYSGLIDYERMRYIANEVGAFLHCDMAHFCGLVAGRAMKYQAARDYSVILAIAVALREAQSHNYQEQQRRVVEGSRILADSLKGHGYTIVGGGTDTHMVLIDLKDRNIHAAEAEKVLELVHIICNQNSIPGDKGGICSGLRLGTPPMVLRGLYLSRVSSGAYS
ncbi:hypothetical protein VSDG_06032 [Cytospora chrysosperma]|uniref:Serine hydroxymethyltransferase-like domain-containing protein n=1 Tax=Cytospora chrysosperma TaxID=252740 RepID=A0A423VWA6_CYTCH|nr:hypothetical protein VSDG_06032 [Valsa sordida]